MNLDANIILAGLTLAATCTIATPAAAAEIRIISTPAASAALRMATAEFERATGHKSTIVFSNIATTRKRLDAGEAFNLVVASPKAIADLVQQGKIAADATLDMGRSGLALMGRKGAPRPDIATAESFRRTLLEARLVAYSATGESGIGFLKVLDKLGITETMMPRLRAAANMAAMVESGEAEIGITGVGAGLTYSELEFIGALPTAVQEYVYVGAGVAVNAQSGAAARALLRYLGEPAVVKSMSENGMEPAAGK
jgi:molybdate transport system substrate-binding protein